MMNKIIPESQLEQLALDIFSKLEHKVIMSLKS